MYDAFLALVFPALYFTAGAVIAGLLARFYRDARGSLAFLIFLFWPLALLAVLGTLCWLPFACLARLVAGRDPFDP